MVRIDALADRLPVVPFAGIGFERAPSLAAWREPRATRFGAEGIARVLGALVETWDAATGAHHRRVGLLGARLAAAIRPGMLDGPALLGLFLHDIGKVGVPSDVIHKTGPLTESEWREIRAHSVIGERLLAGIPGLRSAAPLVRAHHERWDGSGYPDGLSGEEIPLAARLFSVVDAFDAMTSDRPHRRALSVDEAKREMLAGAGSQFDPSVVGAFLGILEGEMGHAA
ncbi:MAG: HD-GYP domain-containing protein [Acidobacteria bacterium]|nr:HD-GYP domain-containing protein [Acidobacteriota bacterium]